MSGPTNQQVVNHWAANAGTPDADVMHGENSVITSADGTTLYSYGHHFPLGQIIPLRGQPRGFWLLNGDQWHGSSGWGGAALGNTAGQQRAVREAVQRTGLPVLIVPESVLTSAGIIRHTIVPVDITDDRTDYIDNSAATLNGVPEWSRTRWNHETQQMDQLQPGEDGRYHWETQEHTLGASLFRASYTERDWASRAVVTRRALFLSAFDTQEGAGAYFLCQLPSGYSARPKTVAEAFELLKPQDIVLAERAGLDVLRQGDIWAIPTGADTERRIMSTGTNMRRRMSQVLNTNHVATDVIEMVTDGRAFDAPGVQSETFARGILWHKPVGRPPDHRRVVLGDRRTWYRLVKNTVPADSNGESRSWSPPGSNGGRGRVD